MDSLLFLIFFAFTFKGGFYGSGGARSTGTGAVPHHPEAMARQSDISELVKIMSEVDVLEQELRSLGNAVNTRTIEIKARMKKAISNPKVHRH